MICVTLTVLSSDVTALLANIRSVSSSPFKTWYSRRIGWRSQRGYSQAIDLCAPKDGMSDSNSGDPSKMTV